MVNSEQRLRPVFICHRVKSSRLHFRLRHGVSIHLKICPKRPAMSSNNVGLASGSASSSAVLTGGLVSRPASAAGWFFRAAICGCGARCGCGAARLATTFFAGSRLTVCFAGSPFSVISLGVTGAKVENAGNKLGVIFWMYSPIVEAGPHLAQRSKAVSYTVYWCRRPLFREVSRLS
jgi:hypothetical protein